MSDQDSPTVFTITDAQVGLTQEQRERQRRYLISMSLRTVCFLGAVAATGVLRWILVAGAVLLPYFAVVIASIRKREISSPEQMQPDFGRAGPIEIPHYPAE